jgi:hypothetical protein
MKHLLRRGIERLPAPLPLVLQDAFRYVRYPQVRSRRRAQHQIIGRLATPDRVAQGPFRGMKPIAAAYCSEFLPKLVGTYEREIAPAVEAICAAGCDRIIDIGAAEGYYAVGMAMRNPDAVVIAFEMNPSARYYLRQLAERNHVSDRLQIQGTCNLTSLAVSLEGARHSALICDCEGAEDLLLDPARIEPLRHSYILVETHDGLATDSGVLAGIGRRLHERFGATHAIETIDSQPRSGEDLPAGTQLSPEESAEAMNEGRPWARWLFMTPRL